MDSIELPPNSIRENTLAIGVSVDKYDAAGIGYRPFNSWSLIEACVFFYDRCGSDFSEADVIFDRCIAPSEVGLSSTFEQVTGISGLSVISDGDSPYEVLSALAEKIAGFSGRVVVWDSSVLSLLKNAYTGVNIPFPLEDAILDGRLVALKDQFYEIYPLELIDTDIFAHAAALDITDVDLNRSPHSGYSCASLLRLIDKKLASAPRLAPAIEDANNWSRRVYGVPLDMRMQGAFVTPANNEHPQEVSFQLQPGEDYDLVDLYCLDSLNEKMADFGMFDSMPDPANASNERYMQLLTNLSRSGSKRIARHATNAALLEMEMIMETFPNVGARDYIFGKVVHSFETKQPFAIDPILLDGPPGVGKTEFTKQLAAALELPFFEFNIGSFHGRFEVIGAHKTWMGAEPGRMTAHLINSKTCNSVVLMDEIETARASSTDNVVQPLYQMLDRGQCTRVQDNYYDMQFDFSPLNFVAATNDLHAMNSALKSRFQIYPVTAPTKEEMRSIIHSIYSRIRTRMRADYLANNLPEATVDMLSDLLPREARTAIDKGISASIIRRYRNGNPESNLEVLPIDLGGKLNTGVRSIGFSAPMR